MTGCTIRQPSTRWWHEAIVYEQLDAVQGWPRDLVNNQKPDQLKLGLKPKFLLGKGQRYPFTSPRRSTTGVTTLLWAKARDYIPLGTSMPIRNVSEPDAASDA